MPHIKSRTNRGFINWRAGAGARGPLNVDETITLGVGAGVVLTATTAVEVAIALGLSAGTTAPAAGQEASGSVALGVQADVAFLDERNTVPQPVTIRVALGTDFSDEIHFGTTRRGNSAVTVKPKFTGKVTVR